MRKLIMGGFAVLGLGLAAQQAQAQVLAQVGGDNITLQQVEAANPNAANDPKLRMETIIALVNRQALLNEAHWKGIDQQADYKKAIASSEQDIAINMLADAYFKEHPVSEKTIKDEYNKLMQQKMPQEYRLREILVPSYDVANKVISDLKAGKDFSILAEQLSIDKVSGQLGGEVGWQPATRLRAQVLKTIESMKQGTVAGPISLPEGYAVIQLLGSRTAPKPTFDELKDKIAQQIRQQEWIQYIIKVRGDQHAHLVATKSGG